MTRPTESSPAFERAVALIDEANRADPRREPYEGRERPREWVYSQHMSRWLERIEPASSEALRLAVRAQHLRRWELPRDSYPAGRSGYLRWRRDCAAMHARLVGDILVEAGYGEPMVQRVQSLVRKLDRQSDPEAQTLEDVACLVFLEHYLEGLAARTEEAKMAAILAKTWRKMSPRARKAALDLPLPVELSSVLPGAVGPDVGPGRRGVE